jgi:predicted amidohydrolase YtcJ
MAIRHRDDFKLDETPVASPAGSQEDGQMNPGPADGAIVGASLHTLDPFHPAATAAAWRDGVLVAVGDDAEVREHIGPATDVLDGAGATVVPGLVDTHIHPFHGTESTRGVDLREARTLDDVRRLLAAERARCGPDAWVLGHSVRYEPFHASGIRAEAIADAIGASPALVGFYDGHTALATEPALALAGVDGPRQFTEYAEVVCDPDGRPTGALLENGAMELVRGAVPSWSLAERLDAYAATFRAFNAAGLTGVQAMLGDPELLDAVRALEERGELTARLIVPMHLEPAVDEATVEAMLALPDARGRLWRTGTAKFFLDGVLDSGTAWLVEAGPGGLNADPFWPDLDRYRELVDRFTAAGFSCITHAVGDGAVRGALDAYAEAGPPSRGMHRVEHIETLTDEDLPRFAALGVAAGMQPLHLEGLDEPDVPSSWVDGLSEGRYERGFRAGDLARSGAVVALGSDWMVADFDPRVGIAWAMLRRKPAAPDHVPYLPEQALDAATSLRGYTTAAAAVAGTERYEGRLAPGLVADITVLGADPLAVAPDELPDVPVRATVVDGEAVYRGDGAA